MHARNQPFPGEILSFEENVGYRLNAETRVLDHVEQNRAGRRPRVLIVEDSEEWGSEISKELTRRGFGTRVARWTEQAHALIEDEVPDLISLDLELPASEAECKAGHSDAQHALEFLDYLHPALANVPVTILTGIPWRDQVMLEVLRKGVRIDDYLSKHSDNSIGRLANSLARLWQETLTDSRILDWDPSVPLHPVVIDPEQKVLSSVSGYPVKATGKGVDILKVLSATPNVFVSRSELIEVVYGDETADDGPEDVDRALNQHIKRLRKTITDATAGLIPGDEIIYSDRGIYWLRGILQ
jgi:DNA-binding response OmpR family regulator